MGKEFQPHVSELIDEAIRLLNHMSQSPNIQMAIEHLEIAKDKVNQNGPIESWGWLHNT
ncbi:hypothetical protein [Lihuaxuella thermophila]|uniref:Uncharacterized protein n=1 Tax=Lihuaxuella thermophila TaxID=1173111 RepID=A0A1H8BNV1_9BACL|nr:hypothetical protein [Lihuaxuella thermophila]SEM84525.1 hypothetical protein SAMN05444955_102286 [Lihuaxuella thermophila]